MSTTSPMTASRTPAYQLPTGKPMFEPGDTVFIRQLPKESPRMVVKEAIKAPHPTEPGRKVLIGIQCFWFNNKEELQEQLFNTKDLEIEEKARKADIDLTE